MSHVSPLPAKPNRVVVTLCYLIGAALLCLGVGVVGILATADSSVPPDYHKTNTCPTEDSCDWLPVGTGPLGIGLDWDWVPVVP